MERERERGNERRLNRALRAPTAGGEGVRRSPLPGPAESRAGPAGRSVGSGHGMARRPPFLTCRSGAHLSGPATPAPRTPSPGSTPGWGGDGDLEARRGAAAGAVAPNCNKRTIRSDSQAFMG